MSGMLRRLPHHIEAEMSLIGAILVNNRALDRVNETVRPEHFVLAEHGAIYERMAKVIGSGGVADPVTMRDWAAQEIPEDRGGAAYMVTCADCAVMPIVAGEYAAMIQQAWVRRRLIEVGEELVDRGYSADEGDHIGFAEAAVSGLRSLGGADNWVSIGDAAERALQAADRTSSQKEPAAIRTGLVDLDGLIGGLKPGKLYVIAGRPAMGKSAIGLNIAMHAARNGRAGALFSLEMPAEDLGVREMSARSHIDGKRIDDGQLSPEEFVDLNRIISKELRGLPLFINDKPGLTVDLLRASARRLNTKRKLSFIMVDYLQLLRTAEAKRDWSSVGLMSMGLKEMAKEMRMPVVALAQLSRDVEKRDNKRPMMSDLRESGNIEQDADVILMMYREEVYADMTKPHDGDPDYCTWAEERERVRGLAEAIVVKQRGGPTGTAHLFFDAKTTTFGNLETRREY